MFSNEVVNAKMERDRVLVRFKVFAVKQKHQMTRKERHDRLKEMWNKMAINYDGPRDNFMGWQEMTSTLLSFNSQLQSEFRAEIKSISDDPPSGMSMSSERYKPTCNRIRAILSQAINELSIPEEQTTPVLTDEHGIWWFINHCTWKSRILLFSSIIGAACLVFGVGFKLGGTEWARNLYREYMSLPSPAPTAAPKIAQPDR